MLRERIVSLGRRDARGRVAYLLCELLWRHAAVGPNRRRGVPAAADPDRAWRHAGL